MVSHIKSRVKNLALISVGLPQQLTIQRSESFNWQKSGSSEHTPDKVHDGDSKTWYSVKDGEVSGNFLKLYLLEAFSITKIEVTSRKSSKYLTRMNNTEASVYSTVEVRGGVEVTSCGKIMGKNLLKGSDINLKGCNLR